MTIALPEDKQLTGQDLGLLHVTDVGLVLQMDEAQVTTVGASFETDSFSTYILTSAGNVEITQYFNDANNGDRTLYVPAGGSFTITYTNAPGGVGGDYHTWIDDTSILENPSHTYDGENEPSETEKNDKTVIGKTPESNTKTYTTGIKVVKIDAKTGERLKGAEFQAQGDGLNKVVYTQATSFKEDANGTYYKLKNGTYTDTVPTGSTSKYYDSTTVKYSVTFTESNKTQEKVEGENTVKMITDDTGIATFEGLGNGTYTLKETKAPEGYNLLGDTFSVTLDSAPSLDGPNWTVDGKEVDLDESGLIIKEFVIENNKGVTLPGTGGMGTTLFYVVGGALVAGAGVLFVTKKRMNIKEK